MVTISSDESLTKPSDIELTGEGLAGPSAAFAPVIRSLRDQAPTDIYAAFLRDPAIRTALRGQARGVPGGHMGEPRRRWLATLFADLEGYSRLCESVSAESLWDLMSDWWRDAADAVYGQSGWLNKVDGDGVMAIFGLHEQAGEPAVRAAASALDIAAGYAEYAETVGVLSDCAVGIRIGLEVGEVVSGVTILGPQPVYDVLGQPVNLAFELSETGPSNVARVGPVAYAKTASEFQYREAGETQLADMGEAAKVYQLIGRLQ